MRHQGCAKAHTMKTPLVYPEGPDLEFQVKWPSNIRPHDVGAHAWYQGSSCKFTAMTGFQPDEGAATCQSSEQMNSLVE